MSESDAITNAIALVGCREVARRVMLSPTTVSLFAQGKLALPMDRVLNICDACKLDKSGVWTATIYDRMEACERYFGFRFHKEDQKGRDE
jgi:DNA-binding transcriptional regulator YdaS (Cro superfamily)